MGVCGRHQHWNIEHDGTTNDKSGAGGGNGDYTTASNSILRNRIPAGKTIMPYDYTGRAIPTTGAALGALQPESTSAGYGTLSGISPTTVLGF